VERSAQHADASATREEVHRERFRGRVESYDSGRDRQDNPTSAEDGASLHRLRPSGRWSFHGGDAHTVGPPGCPASTRYLRLGDPLDRATGRYATQRPQAR
jgi:hypothetical protein